MGQKMFDPFKSSNDVAIAKVILAILLGAVAIAWWMGWLR